MQFDNETVKLQGRSAGGAEVDLIVEREGLLFPMEIKITSNPRPNDASGLTVFRAAHPSPRLAPGLIVCAVEQPRRVTPDVMAIPWNWLAVE
jgi:hypothetical protein